MLKSIVNLCAKTKSNFYLQCKSFSDMHSVKKIGFIGLGNMGSKMSTNLKKNGYDVLVYDKNTEALKRLTKNLSIVQDPNDLAGQVDCVITMLPSGLDVIDVFTGTSNIVKNMRRGTLVIDCSTVDPHDTLKVASSFEGLGVMFIDAPVSGGVVAAEKGSLTFMVGGEEKAVEHAKPILLSMGTNVVHCGPLGSGEIAKVCNNLLLAISMVGLSEVMTLGKSLGLDPNLLRNVINISSGRCWSSELYSPVPGTMENVPSSNNYIPGFSSRIMLKDLNIAKDLALRKNTPISLGEHTHKVYQDINNSSLSDLDFSVVYKFLQKN